MAFYLSKILEFLTQPISWFLFFLLLAYVKKSRKWLLYSFFFSYFFSNDFIADEFMRVWEYKNTPLHQPLRKVKAAILLGGFTSYDVPSRQTGFHESSDRLLYACWLYQNHFVEKIIVSGGNPKLYDDFKEAELTGRFLQQIGIPPSDIILETQSRNTYENAFYIKQIQDSLPEYKEFYLITSAYHMRRALACFKKAEISVIPFVVDMQSGERKFFFDHLFLPSMSAWRKWQLLFHEWIGMSWYFLLGKI